jgi:hypothetical protein
VSGNQELLALNCGEHKPQTVSCSESNRSEARALVASQSWQATEKQPSSTDKTEQHLWKANHPATGVAKNGTQPFKLTISSSMTQVVTIAQAI